MKEMKNNQMLLPALMQIALSDQEPQVMTFKLFNISGDKNSLFSIFFEFIQKKLNLYSSHETSFYIP